MQLLLKRSSRYVTTDLPRQRKFGRVEHQPAYGYDGRRPKHSSNTFEYLMEQMPLRNFIQQLRSSFFTDPIILLVS